jgi:hypothetical protein
MKQPVTAFKSKYIGLEARGYRQYVRRTTSFRINHRSCRRLPVLVLSTIVPLLTLALPPGREKLKITFRIMSHESYHGSHSSIEHRTSRRMGPFIFGPIPKKQKILQNLAVLGNGSEFGPINTRNLLYFPTINTDLHDRCIFGF